MRSDKERAHQLLDRLGPRQLSAILRLLDVMVESAPGKDLSEDSGKSIPVQRHAAELGFTEAGPRLQGRVKKR